MKWTSEQFAVINSFGHGQAVIAGAGCGKTSTLVAKCEEFVKRFPKSRVLAISFTERSAEDLRLKLTQSGVLNPEASHWVGTIHGFCSEVIRQFPDAAGIQGDETVLSEPEATDLWLECVELLWGKRGEWSGAWERWLEREHFDRIPALLLELRVERITAQLLGESALDQFRQSLQANRDLGLASDLEWWVSRAYDERLEKNGQQDFFSLEWRAVQATANAGVQEYFRSNLDLVLVDEFQDTNRLQGRLIEQIIRLDRSNVCIVGDPKQSIYRFRGADVQVFEDFRQKLPVQQVLSMNFRSRPGIIEFINRVCEPLFSGLGMNYHRLEAGVPTSSGGDSCVSVARPGDGVRDGVLLLRRLKGKEDWLRELHQKTGVEVHVPQGGALGEQPVIRELLALCRWLCWPEAKRSAGIVLRAPWFRLPWETVLGWADEDATIDLNRFFSSSHPWSEKLLAFRNARAEMKFSELLREEWLASSWSLEERGWAEILRRDWEARELRGEVTTEILESMQKELDRGLRHPELPPEMQQGTLVLTVHGSKGLEFDCVVLADFPSRPKRIEMPLLYKSPDLGLFLAERDPQTGERTKSDPREAPFREWERLEQVRESARLFYVALTRAKEELVLWREDDAAVESESETEPTDHASDDWKHWVDRHCKILPHKEGLPERDPDSTSMSAPDTTSAEIAPPAMSIQWTRTRQSVSEWQWAERCPSGYAARYLANSDDVSDAAVGEAESIESAQLFGTQMHARLATLWRDEAASPESSDLILPEPFESQVWSWRAELQTEFPGWRWLPELALEVPLSANATFVGILDLAAHHPETGEIYFWDYKVSLHPRERATTPEFLLSRYGLQLKAYRWALNQLEPAAVIRGIEGVMFSPTGVERVAVLSEAMDLLHDSQSAVDRAQGTLDRIIADFSAGKRLLEKPNPQCPECPRRAGCASFLANLQADSLPL